MQPNKPVDLYAWSLGFLEFVSTLQADTTVNSQLLAGVQHVHGHTTVLWHAKLGSTTLYFQDPYWTEVPVVREIHQTNQKRSYFVEQALEIGLVPSSELAGYQDAPFTERYLLGQKDSHGYLLCHETSRDGLNSTDYVFWGRSLPPERFFHNFRRLTAHFVHLSEYQLRTIPVSQ